MDKKPLIVLDLSSSGKGGGPYTSSIRVMNSSLNNLYNFKTIIYRTEIGRFISIKRILDLKRQLKNLEPDIVHFTGLQLRGFHLAIACKLAGIKRTIVTVHGFSGDALDINNFKRFFLTFLFEPLTLLLTEANYGVSKYVIQRKMMKLFSYKSYGYIYNLPPKPLPNKDRSIREELGLQVNDVLVLTIGRITKDKGYHIFDEAIIKLKGISNLKFVIVGKGDYSNTLEEKLKQQIKDKQVFILGYRSDTQQLISSSDIFVLPTLHETLSIALLEASIEGIPLIASNTGGVPEIIQDGYNGLLVRPGKVYELTNAILKLYKSPHLRVFFGKNAKKKAEEKFSREAIVFKINDVYQSLLNRKKSSSFS